MRFLYLDTLNYCCIAGSYAKKFVLLKFLEIIILKYFLIYIWCFYDAQEMKFLVKDLFSKCDQLCSFLHFAADLVTLVE